MNMAYFLGELAHFGQHLGAITAIEFVVAWDEDYRLVRPSLVRPIDSLYTVPDIKLTMTASNPVRIARMPFAVSQGVCQ